MIIEKDIFELLLINQTTFPFAYKDMSSEERNVLVGIWHRVFKGHQKQIVFHAFENALKVCKMPVTPADVFEQIGKLEKATQESDEELWDIFVSTSKQISDLSDSFEFTYIDYTGISQGEQARNKAVKLFAELHPIVKEFCGSIASTIAYGARADDELLQFIKPQFLKQIKGIRERVKLLEQTPREILEMAENCFKRMPDIKNLKLNGGTKA